MYTSTTPTDYAFDYNYIRLDQIQDIYIAHLQDIYSYSEAVQVQPTRNSCKCL